MPKTSLFDAKYLDDPFATPTKPVSVEELGEDLAQELVATTNFTLSGTTARVDGSSFPCVGHWRDYLWNRTVQQPVICRCQRPHPSLSPWGPQVLGNISRFHGTPGPIVEGLAGHRDRAITPLKMPCTAHPIVGRDGGLIVGWWLRPVPIDWRKAGLQPLAHLAQLACPLAELCTDILPRWGAHGLLFMCRPGQSAVGCQRLPLRPPPRSYLVGAPDHRDHRRSNTGAPGA
jgi:hypothetical protein